MFTTSLSIKHTNFDVAGLAVTNQAMYLFFGIYCFCIHTDTFMDTSVAGFQSGFIGADPQARAESFVGKGSGVSHIHTW